MTLPQRTLSVVGAAHPNKGKGKGVNRAFEITMCRPCELVQLVPEPKNPVDESAIAVFSARNIQIGYVRADIAPFLSALLARGQIIRAIFQESTTWGALIRVAFDGEQPILPERKAGSTQAQSEESDWYPDEDYGDEGSQ